MTTTPHGILGNLSPNRGALIALVGADGSGKSTLANMLSEEIGRHRQARAIYLGLGSADIRDRIAALPVIGPPFAAHLVRRADQARDREQRIPGVTTALVMIVLSRLRFRRYRRAHRARALGYVVVSDRYPQTEVPGIYDGPLLSEARPGNAVVHFLAKAERDIYERMASVPPDLVIKLHVSVKTSLERKPDHRRRDVEAKVAVTRSLNFGGAACVDIDADRPLEAVFGEIAGLVLPALGIDRP